MPVTLVTGCAGFIGSHLTDRLLNLGHQVVGVDNFSRGTKDNLHAALNSPHFRLVEADFSEPKAIRSVLASAGFDTVWHLVANSDIGAGVANPAIDLRDTFLTTFHLLNEMAAAGIKRFAFSSSSAIYGVHDEVIAEDSGPLFPISSYGAMKLASEAAVSTALERFLERAWIFRFPNVIGPRATHGIIFDLLTKLSHQPPDLEVLGDGSQQKPYLHVAELVEAMLFIREQGKDPLNFFNIGPSDEGVTVQFIAEQVIHRAAPHLNIRFTGGKKGWVGDIPKFRYSIKKLRNLGWSPQLSSPQAIQRAIEEIHSEFQARTA